MTGDYYHVYNRGAHKNPIFLDGHDYTRFLQLLYVKNNTKTFKFTAKSTDNIFTFERISKLVDIVSYCLMPNHFHILLREKTDNGMSKFVHKLCTSYVKTYNNKYNHSGTIFQGSYKKINVETDRYFRTLINYIHLNPFGLHRPNMDKLAKSEFYEEAVTVSKEYEFSSFKDYLGETRLENLILSNWESHKKRIKS